MDYELEIYNIVGQMVRHYSGRGEPGVVRVEWDGRNSDGKTAASVIYLYRSKVGSFSEQKRWCFLSN